MYRKSLDKKLEELHIPHSSPNVKMDKTDATPADDKDNSNFNSELIRVMGWALTVCIHLLVISSLYYSVGHTLDSDTSNWEIPQLIAATSIWIYLGAFCTSSSFSSSSVSWSMSPSSIFSQTPLSCPGSVGELCSWEPTVLTRTLYSLAITFPSLSIIFSSVGMIRNFTIFLAGKRSEDEYGGRRVVLLLFVLYFLNIVFIGILAMGLKLPSHYQHLLHHHHYKQRMKVKVKPTASTSKPTAETSTPTSPTTKTTPEKQIENEHEKHVEERPHWMTEPPKNHEELPASIRQAIPG